MKNKNCNYLGFIFLLSFSFLLNSFSPVLASSLTENNILVELKDSETEMTNDDYFDSEIQLEGIQNEDNFSYNSEIASDSSFVPEFVEEEIPVEIPKEGRTGRVNIHAMTAKTSTSKNGITITLVDINMNPVFDPIDKVEIVIKSDLYTSSKTKTLTNVRVFNEFFSFPLIKAYQNFQVTLYLTEGTQSRTFYMKAGYGFSEQSLANGGWNRGTFASRVDSLNYHFGTHRYDRYTPVSNVQDYLEASSYLRSDVIYDSNRGNMSNWIITTTNDGHKYKNRYSYKYIILGNNLFDTYSYGGN